MTEEHARYDTGQAEISPAALLPFGDAGYATPTPADVRAAIRRAQLTGSQVGDLLGVDGRTVRKWVGGEREIPYSAWRLLLIETKALEDQKLMSEPTNISATARGDILFRSDGRDFLVSYDGLNDMFGLRGAEGLTLDQALLKYFDIVREASRLDDLRSVNGRVVIHYEALERGKKALAARMNKNLP